MKRKHLLWLLALLVPSVAVGWPWSRDMMNSPSIKPQEGEMTPFAKQSVPVGGNPTVVTDRLAAFRLANPVAATPESIARGRQYYTIFCVPCHGVSGAGNGPVAKKLPVPPMNLTNDFIQKDTFESWVFAMISFGGRVMPAYANDLSVEERWDVVNYVRQALVKDASDLSAAAAAAATAEKDAKK